MAGLPGYADPITGPIPKSSMARSLWRLKQRIRTLVGLRRGFKIGAAYYKETGTELLARALSRKGTGSKEYRVTFRDGSKLLIHCSLRRPYADIMGPLLLPLYQRIQGLIRPGARVLVLPCATGYLAAWVAGRVGPSGAVVAIDPDDESVRYAQKRYAAPNAAFEIGDTTALGGEIDNSFDAVLSTLKEVPSSPKSPLAELWRVTARAGWMLVLAPAELDRAALHAALTQAAPTGIVEFLSAPDEPHHLALARKPAE